MIERPSGLEPAPADLGALVEDFFSSTFATDNPLITEAVRRMLAAGGKRLRPRFTLLAAEAGGADPRAHLPLAAYMELIHVGTLIHDDVVDRADTRRGVNATAIDFGNRVSVLAGDYLFAWIFKNVTASYAPPIPNILSSTLADITDGEVLQLRALGNLDLTLAPLRVKALRDFGLYFGIAFQMFDDLLDVTASEAELGKPVGNDLRERKMTLPVILALESGGPSFRKRLADFYGGDPDADPAGLADLLARIAATGARGKTRDAIAGYVERAQQSLVPLGSAPARTELAGLAGSLLRDSAARAR